jgi:hypothetical protein
MITNRAIIGIFVFGFGCLLLGGILSNFFIDNPNIIQFVDKVDFGNFKWDWYRALTFGTVGWVSTSFFAFLNLYFKESK